MTTDTPGSTAPSASLTTPEIDAVDCASAPLGTETVNSATMSAIFQRQAERNILSPPWAPGGCPLPSSVVLQTCQLLPTP